MKNRTEILIMLRISEITKNKYPYSAYNDGYMEAIKEILEEQRGQE